jgi:hypothetical protein
VGGKGVRRVLEGIEQTKVKQTKVGIHWDTPLNVKSHINNENQDCEIGIVWMAILGGGWGKKRD